MFVVNELEATQFSILIKEIGWVPANIIKKNMKNFHIPQVIINKVKPDNAILVQTILIHLMLIFYTSKLLLNKVNTTVIIQQYIEINTYRGFGNLFNAWVRLNQSLFTLNLQKLNMVFNKLNASDAKYKVPNQPKYGMSYEQLQHQERHYYVAEMKSIQGKESEKLSIKQRTRKSSFTSLEGNFDMFPDLSLSKNTSYDQKFYYQPSMSRHSSIGRSGLYYDDMMLGKRLTSENGSVCSEYQDIRQISRSSSKILKVGGLNVIEEVKIKEKNAEISFDLNFELKKLNV